MTTEIAISRIHFPVTRLGPGRRVGIWVQGCSIRCPGCISVDTWAQGRGRIRVSEVLDTIAPWISIADGFTISGGEPFDQSGALTSLLVGIRKRSAADILVFTGYSLEEIGTQLSSMEGLIDALIADPFDETAPQTLALRGSDNQRLVRSRHWAVNVCRIRTAADMREQTVDLMFDTNGEVWLVGIPCARRLPPPAAPAARDWSQGRNFARSEGLDQRRSRAGMIRLCPNCKLSGRSRRFYCEGNRDGCDVPLGSVWRRDQRARRRFISSSAPADNSPVPERPCGR